MAATATLQILGTIINLPGGGVVPIGPLTITNAVAVGTRYSPLDLGAGNNTIAVPTGSKGMVFIPPTINTQTITLKPGDATGTGIPVSKTQPWVLSFDTPAPATITFVAGGTIAGCELAFL